MNRKVLILLALCLLCFTGLSVKLRLKNKATSQSQTDTTFVTGGLMSGVAYHIKGDYAGKYLEGRDGYALGMVDGFDGSSDEFWTATQNSNGFWTLKSNKYGQYLNIGSNGASLTAAAQELYIYPYSSGSTKFCIRNAYQSNRFLRYKTYFMTGTACSDQELWKFWFSTLISGETYYIQNKAYPEQLILWDAGEVTCQDNGDGFVFTYDSAGYWRIKWSGSSDYYLQMESGSVTRSSGTTDNGKFTIETYSGDSNFYCIKGINSGRYIRVNRVNGDGYANYYVITQSSCGSQEAFMLRTI